MSVYTHSHLHTYTHLYIHTYIHTHTHTSWGGEREARIPIANSLRKRNDALTKKQTLHTAEDIIKIDITQITLNEEAGRALMGWLRLVGSLK